MQELRMPVQDLYRAEVVRRQQAREKECAPYEAAKAQLADLYKSLTDDQDFVRELRAEIELLDDDLRIDNGPLMIVLTAQQAGGVRLEYEVKKPGNYESTPIPHVRTIEDAERSIARLLAEYPRDKD
jgi:hypothetical protein